MSEMKRWTAEGATELEAKLLAAARGGGASPAARAQIAEALRATLPGAAAGAGAAAAATRAATAGSKMTAAVVAKWLAVAALAGGGAALAWRLGAKPEASPDAQEIPRVAAPADAASSRELAPMASPSALDVAPAPARPHLPAKTTPAAATASSQTPGQSPTSRASVAAHGGEGAEPEASATSSLDAELRLLEEAKANLDSGSPHGALALLGDYRRRHPGGLLALEADVLRIDALVAAGRRRDATRAAAAFVAAHPHATQTPRLRALANSADE